MSAITSIETRGLMEAYQAVYSPPQEITEEQVWEEVEEWVNALLEEGYDLSDYTWEEMYEEFMLEARDVVKDATYTGDAAEQERMRQRDLKRGFDPDKERAEARRKAKEELLRNRSKNTTVPGGNKADSPFSGKPQPQPSQPSGGSGGRGTPPLPPSSSTTTPSSQRAPQTYSNRGVGRRENTRKPTNLGKGPTVDVAKASANTGKNALKGLKGGSVLSGVIDTALEKSSGSGWARSLAKGTASALGTLGGGALGSVVAGPVGTYAGGTAGAMAAGKAFDTVAGANAVGRKAIATANRKSQTGGGLVGTGGKTTFDTKKNTITSGGKTAQLGKTSVVNDPKTGKQGVGYLAYKGGKAVYKKADTKSLAQTSSNPLERIGRSLFAGAYKANDAKLAATKLKTAATSDATRNKQLGVKLKPGG